MAHVCKSKKQMWHQTMCVHTCEIKAPHTCTYPYEVSFTNDPPYRTAWYNGIAMVCIPMQCVSFRLLWVFGSDPNGCPGHL